MRGPIQVVAVADLGALGDREGPRINYDWVPPSVVPDFLSLAGVVLLLFLPKNHRAQAWLVWMPLVVVWLAGSALSGQFLIPVSGADESVELAFTSVAIGLAILWLLGGYLANLSRVGVFLVTTLIVGVSGLFAYGTRWQSLEEEVIRIGFLVATELGLFLISLGLTLGSLLCRQKYSAGRFVFWFAIIVFGGWLLVGLPVLIIATVTAGLGAAIGGLFAVMVVGLVTLATAFPFLLLSFLVPFYRQRFMALYRLPQRSAPSNEPPMISGVPQAPT